MNYKKIEETIKSRNFALKFFIPKVTGMTVQGFNQAIKRETIKLRDVEKITNALGLPMSYWWEDDQDDFLIKGSGPDYGFTPEKEKMYQDAIRHLGKRIDELEEQLEKKEHKKRAAS